MNNCRNHITEKLTQIIGFNYHTFYLFIISKSTHYTWVNDAIQFHGQRIDRFGWILVVFQYHETYISISSLHRLDRILQWTDLVLIEIKPALRTYTRKYL